MYSKAAVLLAAARSADAKQPHIFMVLVDDWGWNNVGYHQEGKLDVLSDAKTPNIDKLAQDYLTLDRHYVHSWCSPSRSSLQTGRLPVHVSYTMDPPEVHNPADPVSGYSGIPRHMTGIAAKLRSGGYRTHMTGKWDAGMATWDHTPMGRGYETFFGYFHHANDYYDQTVGGEGTTIFKQACSGVDLWDTSGPAVGRNGTAYEEEMFTNNTLSILDRHDPAEPLFMFHSFHVIHAPLQVPTEWEKKFEYLLNDDHRKYSAMVAYMDDAVGQFTRKLQEKGMWEDTLMVLSSDNGGPIYGLPNIPFLNFGKNYHGGASNLPLRGGKMSDFEGGIRVNAFVAGGLVPKERRGFLLEDYIHIADWYATFCHLAGVDPVDDRAAAVGLPPVDSMNQWPLISGEAELGTGNRTEIHVSHMSLIQGQYKLVMGGVDLFEHLNKDLPFNVFPLPIVPMDGHWNGYGIKSDFEFLTSWHWCLHGCLYDIRGDPNEQVDLAAEHPKQFGELRKNMKARLDELNTGLFNPNRGEWDPAVCDQVKANGGFWGPWVDVVPPAPLIV